MKTKVNTYLLCIITSLAMSIVSCRKDVTLDLPDYQQKVVIEGSIETGSPALVFLSWSVPYFGEFDYSTPDKAFIRGGKITVTDGIVTDTLKELDPSYGYIYSGFKLFGQEGKSYTISVTVSGKTFTTSTSILKPAALDSLFFEPRRDGDSLGFMNQKFSEPAGSGDCYRWYAKRQGRDLFYAAPFNSVFDDKFIDGQTFEFGYDRGEQPIQTQAGVDRERGYYKRGDTVVVKLCKIGRREYEFWTTYYQNKLSNGNPFSAPANVKSMFGNYLECFGGFVGYSPAFDTLVIPE